MQDKPTQFCILMDYYDKHEQGGLFIADRPLSQAEWSGLMEKAESLFAWGDLVSNDEADEDENPSAWAAYPNMDELVLVASRLAGLGVVHFVCAEIGFSD